MGEIQTPWERSKKRPSQKQEERTAKMTGARPQVNSGRIWSSLRDVKLKSFLGMILIDNKTLEKPENKTYKLDRDEWLKLREDARKTPPLCHPALQVDLQDVHLMVFELALWDDLVQYVQDLEIRMRELEDENKTILRGRVEDGTWEENDDAH